MMTSKQYAEHARNGWRHGYTESDFEDERARGISYFWSAAIVIIVLAAMVSHCNSNLSTVPLDPTETIIRYERTINGVHVRCERRVDHVRGTTETAC